MFFLFFVCLIKATFSCKLSGQEIGQCLPLPFSRNSFCGSVLADTICLPSFNQTWSQYSAQYKQNQIEAAILQYLQQQLINEYEYEVKPLIVANNPDCFYAYKNFLCNWNFPICNLTQNQSKQPCLSLCVNFYSACGGISDACEIIYSSISGLRARQLLLKNNK